jgi:hypothetical protein
MSIALVIACTTYWLVLLRRVEQKTEARHLRHAQFYNDSQYRNVIRSKQ